MIILITQLINKNWNYQARNLGISRVSLRFDFAECIVVGIIIGQDVHHDVAWENIVRGDNWR